MRLTTYGSSDPDFKPFFEAVDYFDSGRPGGDEWNEVRFIPLEIAGGSLDLANPATYVLPSGAASVKYLSTRTRLDALGKPFYIQGPDPSPQPNDTPTTVITYEHVPALDATSVTTRLSVFDNASDSLTGIDTSYPREGGTVGDN